MNDHRLMKIILAPVISEKSALGADSHDQYTFRVLRDATKPEIKAAVEKMFEVKVEGVTTSNVKGKTKRFAMNTGKRSDWKKATVKLQAGQEIDFIGAE
jgi:large subunit ribosomal protein L23